MARIGGDEFAIIFSGIAHRNHADRPIARIIRTLSRPMDIGNLEVRIGASVGIAHYPDDAETPEQLVKFADDALYSAKERGRGMAVKTG